MTSFFEVSYSGNAVNDIRDILQYSLDSWGTSQQDEYASAIDRAIDQLAHVPFSGTLMSEKFPHRRRLPLKEHVIIYRVDAAIVTILRIVHKRRDFDSLFIE